MSSAYRTSRIRFPQMSSSDAVPEIQYYMDEPLPTLEILFTAPRQKMPAVM